MTVNHQQLERPMMSRARAPMSLSLRTIVRCLLWVFVFSQPWDTVILPGVGAISRLIGLLTLGVAFLTVSLERRFHKPHPIFWLAAAFVVATGLSLFWTIAPDFTTARTWTYAQLLGSVWILGEFARTREDQKSLFLAYCLGAFVPLTNMLNNFRQGKAISQYVERYTSDGPFRLNADNLALTLVIAMSMAWYLVQRRGGIGRVVGLVYLTVGPVGVLLTATRGAFLAALVPLVMGPFAQARLSRRSILGAGVLLAIIVTATATVVPSTIWARIGTIQSEVTGGGTMGGRVEIWTRGIQVFLEHPFLGVGAAAFGPALGKREAPHNIALGVLAEQGITGLVIFAALLGACAVAVVRLPPPERKIWTALMLSWFIGALTMNYEETKVTWLLFGLLGGISSGLAGDASRSVTGREHVVRRAAALRPRRADGMAQTVENY